MYKNLLINQRVGGIDEESNGDEEGEDGVVVMVTLGGGILLNGS